jgi:signal transduction histidine kinase/streptogramin lyase
MLRFFLVWLSVFSMCLGCSAADISSVQLHHKAWRAVDGAPSDVSTLAQTKDGFLWLGTATGLYRFDGVRFEPVESAHRVKLLSSAVHNLFASSDGGLWIGYLFGGASYLRSGKITHYPPDQKGEQHLHGGSLNSFTEEQDGTIWANSSHLNVFRNKKWQPADKALPATFSGVFMDRRGGIWTGFSDGLYWRQKGSASFTKVSDKSGTTFFSEAPDGTVWASTNRQGFSRFDPSDGRQLHMVRHLERAGVAGELMFDREGNLWCATSDRFLVRIPKAVQLQEMSGNGDFFDLFTEKEGLSGGLVTDVLQDREGNIWVSTSSGVDQLRASRVAPIKIPAPDGAVVLTMTAAEDGKVWVSDWGSGLYLVGSGAELVDKNLLNMTFMYRAASGRVWMGNRRELWMRENAELKRISWPVETARTTPQAAFEDSDGGLWVSLGRQGVFRLFEGSWENKSALFGGTSRPASVMAQNAAGGFWVGYGPDMALINGQSFQEYGATEGLNVGPIRAITASRGRIWAAGVDGVVGQDGQRFHPLKGRYARAFKGVSGIIVTRNGDLWMNGNDGFIYIPSAELVKWAADKSYGVTYEVLNYLDGVLGKPVQTRPLPTALEASDGRLWFTTGKNITVVDPSKVIRNTLPPPVAITRVDIDGVEADRTAPIVLKPDALRIEIAFAGLSLTIPERNRYRYRLVGVDREWMTASRSRSVSYTNLTPGNYRFEVSASNNDGVWSTGPAQLNFEVLPVFYQTWWFRFAIVLLVGLALWLAHRLRMKVLTRRISDRLQSQQMERVRIARELHDTLLQGVGSLSLVMRSAINKIDREHPVVPYLSSGLKQAESVIDEGRKRVARLRVNVAAGDVLIDELGSLGAELTADSKTRFELTVQGDVRPLETQVAEECRIIVREAIWNAVQHASAGSISLSVEFRRRTLVLRVRDDGDGLPPKVLAAGSKEGHWGLPGMRERASRIGGQLDIIAVKGTTITLEVPARLAYRHAHRAESMAV